jgi:flagellar assembly protein FliH
MGLIKSNNSPVSLMPFSMADIEQQARAMLQQARQRAAQIVSQAHAEAAQIKEQVKAGALVDGLKQGLLEGREKGRTEGHDAAIAENRQALQHLIVQLTSACQQLEAARQELQSNVVEELIQLAVSIAQRATKRLSELDPQVAVANVSEAVKLAVHAHAVRIAVHPSQRATLEDLLPRMRLHWPKLEHVELVDDDTLSPGGCRVYTGGGVIDASLETQIARIAQDLVPGR